MNVLRQFLEEHCLQQQELANRLGYTPQYMSNLVNGRDPITPAFVGKVTLHFGAAAASLFLPYMGTKLTNIDS